MWGSKFQTKWKYLSIVYIYLTHRFPPIGNRIILSEYCGSGCPTNWHQHHKIDPYTAHLKTNGWIPKMMLWKAGNSLLKWQSLCIHVRFLGCTCSFPAKVWSTNLAKWNVNLDFPEFLGDFPSKKLLYHLGFLVVWHRYNLTPDTMTYHKPEIRCTPSTKIWGQARCLAT